jgi:hypothetical protein
MLTYVASSAGIPWNICDKHRHIPCSVHYRAGCTLPRIDYIFPSITCTTLRTGCCQDSSIAQRYNRWRHIPCQAEYRPPSFLSPFPVNRKKHNDCKWLHNSGMHQYIYESHDNSYNKYYLNFKLQQVSHQQAAFH